MHALGIYGKQYLNISINLFPGFVVIITKWEKGYAGVSI